MPEGKKLAPATGGDLIGALPDALLHHVLSFLPSQEVVRTCVLARRWRHLWRSATVLRIGGGTGRLDPSVKEMQKFVEHFLLLRGGSPLDTCELSFPWRDNEEMPKVKLWIRHALMWKVRVLRLTMPRYGSGGLFELDDLPVVSPHLKRIELDGLNLSSRFLDFSSCPALEDLQICRCLFATGERISSQSIRRLRISECIFSRRRSRFYAPNVVSLQLYVRGFRIPMLERMPVLVNAAVDISFIWSDICDDSYSGDCGNGNCDGCFGIKDDTNYSVLLQGLSEAENLSLISETKAKRLKVLSYIYEA